MRKLRAAALRLFGVFGGARREREFDEELASHLQLHIDDNLRAGLAAEEARRRALISLGGVQQTRERYREQRSLPIVIGALRDIRYGLRTWRKHPGFTLVVIMTLAVGIGATTALFTLANWVLFRPVPGVSQPERISVYWTGSRTDSGSFRPWRLTYPNYQDIAPRLQTLRLAAYQNNGNFSVVAEGQSARPVSGKYVTASYFEVLGVGMAAGRTFAAAEDNPSNATMVCVISDRLWGSLFNRSPEALSGTLTINSLRFNIIGVTAPDFGGTERLRTEDLWLPGSTYPLLNQRAGSQPSRYDDRTTGGFYELVARLNDGASWEQADAELESLRAWLMERYPKENARFATTGFHRMSLIGLPPFGGERGISALLRLMTAASTLVLLIACANVAALMMIRGIHRSDEIAIRKALGAGRATILRQQLIEGMLLWSAGGCAAIVLVWTGTRLAEGSAVPWLGVTEASIPVDWRVLVFTSVLSLAVGLIFSMLPAWRAARAEAIDHLRTAGPATTPPRFRTGFVLTTSELACCLALFVSALLLVATMRHLDNVPLGFEPADLSIVLTTRGVTVPGPTVWRQHQDIAHDLRRLPGVQSVAIAGNAPFMGGSVTRLSPAVSESRNRVIDTDITQVLSADYFDTVGIRLLRGRLFTDVELDPNRTGADYIVLSAGLAKELFNSVDAIGQRVIKNPGPRGRTYEVIGVVNDVRVSSLVGQPDLMAFDGRGLATPTTTLAMMRPLILVRSSSDIVDGVRTAAARVDSGLLTEVIPVERVVSRARFEWDVLGRVVTSLAVAAAVLASLGVYGVAAFAVATRKREFGIRLALGSSPSRLRWLVLRRAIPMVVGGVVLGGAAAASLVTILRSRLVGVEPFSPAVWMLAIAGLIMLAVVASLLPARTATRTSVADVLRAM